MGADTTLSEIVSVLVNSLCIKEPARILKRAGFVLAFPARKWEMPFLVEK